MQAPRLFTGWVFLLVALLGCRQVPNTGAASAPGPVPSLPAASSPEVLARAARAQRGDTVSLPYAELQKFLPPRIEGFVREGQPQGESVQMGGISYSTCEQRYRRGQQHLKVQVVDYNGAQALFAGATALMNDNIWQESDEQLMRGCNLGLPGVRGYETMQKMEHRAAVALGVGDRFFVSVESTGQDDTRLVKAVAQTLDLHALATL
ncbi:hypothetical protein EJV47_12100 [Hymenobacter gummosus]|uniref:Uncharacterized protein n=1 Tax=Hymenobacter gummosus TaxID=1776032 RepID=A0A431U2H2_9BACT|nr:hypothetical protein [Hymenobacter gummosus]RTQ49560.1 hypothetical protein EJV47_12100 [Hymenobacter gummosus]